MVSIMNSIAWQECTSLLIFIKLYERINGTILQFINKYGRGGIMFQIAICDDNRVFLEYERKIVIICLSAITDKFVCDTFDSGEALLSLDRDIDKYDMIILDCKMDIIGGVETAELIRKNNDRVKILFATDYYEFSQSACNYEPIGYLIKNAPDFESNLCCKLKLAYRKASEKQRYLTDFAEGTIKVNIKEIIYINSYDHYLYFYLRPEIGSKQLRILKKRAKMDDIKDALDDSFVRINISNMVNMSYITSIVSGEVCFGYRNFNSKITIKRGEVELIEEKFNKYIGAIEW